MYSKRFTRSVSACTMIFLLSSGYCTATPSPAAPPNPGSISPLHDISQPTCTNPSSTSPSNASSFPNSLSTFPRECIETANYFFNFPLIATTAWHWKRVRPGEPPSPGSNFLPFSAAPTSCVITLDVLDDPRAEDTFALVDVADDFRALYRECVFGRVHELSAGFIPVGPSKVLKLAVGPIPPQERHNFTAGGYEVSEKGGRMGEGGKGSLWGLRVV